PERLKEPRATGGSAWIQETYAGNFPRLLRLCHNAAKSDCHNDSKNPRQFSIFAFRFSIVGSGTEESNPKYLVHTFDALNPKSKTCGARCRSTVNLESFRARSLFPRYFGNQIRQTYKPHREAAVRSAERALDVIGNHQVVALRVGSPERLQVAGVEIG